MSDVIDNVAKARYELVIDGHMSVADYTRRDGSVLITHVEVPESLRGKGVAAQLMAGVVSDAKTRKLTVVPVCSYAVSYLQRHPQ